MEATSMNDSMVGSPTSRSPRSDPARLTRQAGRDSSSEAGRLSGRVQGVEDLTPAERDSMYRVLAQYHQKVARQQFERDLAEKEWAILLADAASGQIRGFSTLMRIGPKVGNQPVVAFFAG